MARRIESHVNPQIWGFTLDLRKNMPRWGFAILLSDKSEAEGPDWGRVATCGETALVGDSAVGVGSMGRCVVDVVLTSLNPQTGLKCKNVCWLGIRATWTIMAR